MRLNFLFADTGRILSDTVIQTHSVLQDSKNSGCEASRHKSYSFAESAPLYLAVLAGISCLVDIFDPSDA